MALEAAETKPVPVELVGWLWPPAASAAAGALPDHAAQPAEHVSAATLTTGSRPELPAKRSTGAAASTAAAPKT